VRDIRQQDIDRIFGRMCRAGLSRSRMNQAKSLYASFFRWAKSRQMTMHGGPLPGLVPDSQRLVAQIGLSGWGQNLRSMLSSTH
jgi:hypothetical protein